MVMVSELFRRGVLDVEELVMCGQRGQRSRVPLATDGYLEELRAFRDGYLEELRAFRAEAREDRGLILDTLGVMMDYFTELVDAIASAESELEAKTAIIKSQTKIITDVRTQLAAVSAHPVPSKEQVDSVIAGLNEHIKVLDKAAADLVAANQEPPAAVPAEAPPATPPAEAPPVVQPPVVEPVQPVDPVTTKPATDTPPPPVVATEPVTTTEPTKV